MHFVIRSDGMFDETELKSAVREEIAITGGQATIDWADTRHDEVEQWARQAPISGGLICRVINTAGGGQGMGGLWSGGLTDSEGSINATQCEQAMGTSYPRLVQGGGFGAPTPTK